MASAPCPQRRDTVRESLDSHECPTGYPLDKPRGNPRVMPTVGSSALPGRWRTTADTLERFAPAVAAAFRECASDLEEAAQDAYDAVTLQEAHLIGGYSVDHLQRLVSQEMLPNSGKKGAPRIPRSAVPIKPGHASGSLPFPAGSDQVSARRRIVADAQTRKGA